MARMRFGDPQWGGRRVLLANIVLFAVYMVTWYFNGLLALPRGYAAPVFPPAGAGFALVVAAGWRVFPGILLGDGLIHLWVLWHVPGIGTAAALAGALTATLGAVLQAWLGARWFRRLVNPAIGSARDVGRFLLLAPLMCLTGASIGVPVLYRLGVLEAA